MPAAGERGHVFMKVGPCAIFLAGIMQGSHEKAVLHPQDYRGQLRDLLARHFPAAELYDPLAEHNDSLSYEERRGRAVFFRHNRMCREVDVLVAFVPEASMGTAIEMWEAYQHGATVVSISPLEHNWAIKYLSHALYRDVAEFTAAVRARGTSDAAGNQAIGGSAQRAFDLRQRTLPRVSWPAISSIRASFRWLPRYRWQSNP